MSAAAALGCAAGWLDDFRADLARISVPVLIVQAHRIGLCRLVPGTAWPFCWLMPALS